ncbi:universal stress protein [Methanocella arvoryzae]|uniref:Universal stress protein A n=1 Tax=Methanocella arvoryzae (strain DSM 22066 / NBRC 105507 / MRE50) TaxID=351160 RepID=Q0W8I0_METAR|nr:universal stress protein [Methanocella arvoryzae]CAJ35313.1 universal stress protein A [Methanocella arvoryzae MRE50]
MEELKYTKLLVPTDGSDYSCKAAEHAAYLARSLGAKIYILNVVNVDLAFRSGIHYAEGMTELRQAGNEATGRIRQICEKYGVECEEFILKGQPADTIVRVSREICASCIVIGSIGTSAIERVLIGSTSEKVMRHAPCPVLLVRHR